jgi:hypothetical protein
MGSMQSEQDATLQVDGVTAQVDGVTADHWTLATELIALKKAVEDLRDEARWHQGFC